MAFIPLLILLGACAWLLWCLKNGRITIQGPDAGRGRKIITINKKTNPFGFWFSWFASLVGSIVVCIYVVVQMLSQTT